MSVPNLNVFLFSEDISKQSFYENVNWSGHVLLSSKVELGASICLRDKHN
jgi:hypothetical protein